MGALACCRRWVALLAALAGGLRTPAPCPGGRRVWNDGADVVFGQTADFSGGGAEFGESVRTGILVAFHDWNLRSGVPVGLTSYDDASDPRCSRNNSLDLIAGDRVLALLGSVGNATSRWVQRVARDKEVVLVGPVSGVDELREEPFVIQTRASFQDEAEMMVRHFVERRYMRWIAVIQESGSYIADIVRDRMAHYRLSPLVVYTLPVGNASVAPLMAQADVAMEVVFLSGSYTWGAAVISRVRHVWPQAEYAVLATLGAEKLGPELVRLVEEQGEGDFPLKTVHIASVTPGARYADSFAIRRYQEAVRAYASEFLNDTDPDPAYDPLVLEGYLIGRLALDVLEESWHRDETGVLQNPQNATQEELRYARRKYMTTIYQEGLFNFDGFSIGPFVLQCDLDADGIDAAVLGNGTGTVRLEPDHCSCTQGMNKVFGNRLGPRGELVRYAVADYTGRSCGAQVQPSYTAFGFRGDADMKVGLDAILRRGGFLGLNRPTIVKCDVDHDGEFAGLFGNIGCDAEEDIAACTERGILPSFLHVGVRSGNLSLRAPFRREIVNVRVSGMDETVALAYFISRHHTRVSILYEGSETGTVGLDGAVAALAAMGVGVWTRGMFSVGSFARGGVALDNITGALDNSSFIAALDNITGAPEAARMTGSPEAILLLGTCTSCMAAFIELARARLGGAVTYATWSMNSDRLAAELKTSKNRDNILVTQVVPLPDDTSYSLVRDYQHYMSRNDSVNSSHNLTFDSLEGYIVGRLILTVFAALPRHFTIIQFLDYIYSREVHDIGDIRLGPYNERCNQGMRTVYFTRMQGNGTFRYDEGMRSETFDKPGTVACGNWTDLGCVSGFHLPPGSEVCAQCEQGFYLECDAACEARERPSGRFEKFNTTCKPCPRGRYGHTPGLRDAGECLTCGFGLYTDSVGQNACSTCQSGRYSVNGSACLECEAGTEPRSHLDSEGGAGGACVACEAGRTSEQGGMCEDCDTGKYADSPGMSECMTCPYHRTPEGGLACYWDAGGICLDTASFILWVVAAVLVSRILRSVVPILDVTMEDGSVMVQTLGPHCIRNYFGVRPEIRLHRTGHPLLDAPPELYRAKRVTRERLELRKRGGERVSTNMSTSTGLVECRFPWTVLSCGRSCLPFSAMLVICVAAAIAMHAVARARPSKGPGALQYGIWAALLVVSYSVVEAGLWLFEGTTPIHKSILAFQKELLAVNPAPAKTFPGPGRAVRAEQLVTFFNHFQNWIGNRTMYYVASNLIMPLTRKYRLSYAEVAGPTKVSWFVSHYWGTPFAHFVDCIRLHFSTVDGEKVVDMRFGDDFKEEAVDAYWICSFSNNQWCLHEELGSVVEESSFYKTLRSGCCVGTAMILDSQALPLTRCWCLFEVLQTVLNVQEDRNFTLMLCTATGVLNFGVSRVDVAMAIAKKLTSLRLEDAYATVQTDKEMIDMAIQHLGSSQVNLFLRSIFRESLRKVKGTFDKDFDALASELTKEKEDAQELQSRTGTPENGLLRRETAMLEAEAVPTKSKKGAVPMIRRRTTKLM